MPVINVTGLSREKLCEISNKLEDLMVEEVGAKREAIRIFYNPAEEIVNGEIKKEKICLYIEWLPRTMELREKIVEAYNKLFEEMGYTNTRFYFHDINKEYYFVK